MKEEGKAVEVRKKKKLKKSERIYEIKGKAQ
jgi:hypothetical protein